MHTSHVVLRLFWRLGVVSMALSSGMALAKIETVQNGLQTTLKVQIDDVRFDDVALLDKNFVQAKLIGVEGHEGIIRIEGEPEIPVVRFLVPGTPTVRKLDSLNFTGHLTASRPIKPVQPSHAKILGAPQPFAWNVSAYESDEMQPQADFDVSPAGSIRGVPQSLVTLYPLTYAPATKTYQLRKSFEVSFTTPQAVEKKPERFVFIVGKNFVSSPSLAAYVSLKQELGFVVDQIVVNPRTKPEAIRSELKNFYKKSDAKLAYALIIGDAEDVPGKDSYIISGVTDHFYRSIDTDDYETDINGPDIGVGRVAVRNESQLAAVLQKFTKYTKGSFSTYSWLNELSFLATNDRWQLAEATHNYVIDTYTRTKGYTGIFPTTRQLGGDQLYAVTHRVPEEKVREALELGRTVIDYSGHGANTYWDAPRLEQDDVRNLADPNALPFVIANACITGDYRVDESFGETWQRHPYGAITYWGSMDSTYWDEDDILERRMFDGIFKGNKRTFAEITHNALTELWTFYGGKGFSDYYWETYVLFGDPSIPLRTAKMNDMTLAGLPNSAS